MRSRILSTGLVAGMVMLASAAVSANAIKTGGEKGDYYLHFGPPLQNVLAGAWYEYDLETGEGTPKSMEWLCQNPTGVAILQGNVYADLADDVGCEIQVIRSDIAGEVVVAVMNEQTYERSEGSWAALARRATRVKFVTSSEGSGPGATFKQLQALDPEGLGKVQKADEASAGKVLFAEDMDKALAMVASGDADVALMVQFANLDNPRFKYIAEKDLHIVPVLDRSMASLKMPDGSPAFSLCSDVQVQKKWLGVIGEDKFIQTACSPMVYATVGGNGEADIATTIADASRDALLPAQSAFRKLLERAQQVGGAALNDALEAASRAADDIAERM